MALAARRWASQWKLFALVLAVAVVAGSVLTGTLLLVRTSEQAGVRAALSSIAMDNVDVSVRVFDPVDSVNDTRAAIDAATAETFGNGTEWTSSGWVRTEWVTTDQGLFSYLAEIDERDAATTLVDGAWPQEWPGVAVPEAAARSLGLSVGASLALNDDDRAISVRVDAIYQAETSSGVFWEYDPLLASGDEPQFPEPNKTFGDLVHAFGPLLVPPGGVDTSGVGATQLAVTERPTFDTIGVADLGPLSERVIDAESAIPRAVGRPGGTVYVDTTLGEALDEVSAGLTATRTAALTVLLLLVVVVAMVVATTTRLLASARGPEFEMLGARGASPAQLAAALVFDATLAGAIVALVSPLGGVLAHALVSGSPSLVGSHLDRWVLPGPDAWLTAVVLGTGVAVLLCLPLPPARAAVRNPSSALRLTLESMAVVAAAVLFWRAVGPSSTFGDPLLAATPAVFVLASGVIGVRLVSGSVKPAADVLGRSRGIVAPVSGWNAARRPERTIGILVVATAVGAAVVVAGSAVTWQASIRELAAVAVGAPARLSGDAADEAIRAGIGAPVTRNESLISRVVFPGLESNVPVASVQVLGLSARARSFLGEESAGKAGGATIATEFPSTDLPESGPLLPRETTAIKATVGVTAPEGVSVAVFLVTASTAGSLFVSELGPVTPGEVSEVLTASIPSSSGSAAHRLVGVTARLTKDGNDSVEPDPVAVRVGALTPVSKTSGFMPVVLDLADATTWFGSNSGRDDGITSVEVNTSTVVISAQLALGRAPVTVGSVGWDPSDPITAVLPEALADDLDVISGAELSSFIAGSQVTLRVVGTTAGVPGAGATRDLAALSAGLPSPGRADSTVVVDGSALVHHLVTTSAPGKLVNELWLNTDAAAPLFGDSGSQAVGGRSDFSVVDARMFGQSMLDAPLRAVLPASFLLVVTAGFVLALAGFAAQTAAGIRERRLESAQLRALGVSQRAMTAIAFADGAFAVLAGSIIGLSAGLGTLAIVGTRLVTAPGWTTANLVLPWQLISLLPVVGVAVLAVTLAVISRAQRGLGVTDLLRAGATE